MSETEDRMDKLRERAIEARLVRRIVLIVLLVLAIGIGGTAGFTYSYIKRSLQPLNPTSTKEVIVTISNGTSLKGVSTILQDKGIIRSGAVFHYYCKYKNESGFMAGTYQLSPSMSFKELIDTLQQGKTYAPVMLKLTIPEGYWVKDIAAKLAKETNLNEKDILKKMANRQYIKSHYLKTFPFLSTVLTTQYKSVKYPLEGYLFPATYTFPKKNPSLDDIINKMLTKTNDVLSSNKGLIAKSKLQNSYQVLTMASLVEGEARTLTDRQKIAGVFFNRLNKGMLLQTDPTISYAEQKHIKSYTHKDLAVSSPYNTYTNKGLPVGPINNPSLISINAVLNPIANPYFYFYARPNGQVLYAKTLSEHNANIRKYQSEWSTH